MSNPQEKRIEQVAAWLSAARSAVAFTGAGISTESGIPDFRSPTGVWARSQPVRYADFCRDPEARHEYWRQKAETHREFSVARPNAGHLALAHWESQGRLRGVITQNIDGLHQAAGSRNVQELHGTALEVACLDCAARFPADPWVERFLETSRVPDCPNCGGRLKHATVSFGQQLPSAVLMESAQWAKEADLFLAIGSSLVVNPAAQLPVMAVNAGARLVILNRDPTPLDDLASVLLRTEIGMVLSAIEAAVK